MQLLIDYDNLQEQHRRQGLKLVIERIIRTLESGGLAQDSRWHARLYGGWYEGSKLSILGQTLSAEIARDFPALFRSASPNTTPAPVTAELALGLAADRSHHFFHTFRRQSPPLDVRCHRPAQLGCSEADCPAVLISDVLHNRRCNISGCTRSTSDLLYRRSQKLVDTMLALDAVSLAAHTDGAPIIVSSDDDVWPALHLNLVEGRPVIQVHTRPGAIRRHPYVRPGRAGYFSIEIA